MKKYGFLPLIILCLLTLVSSCGKSAATPLLSQDSVGIKEIIVYFPKDGAKPLTLNPEDAAAVIKALDKMEAAEEAFDDGEDLTDFRFSLEIFYNEGGGDYLYSDAAGDEYFRFINDDSAILKGNSAALKEAIEALIALE
jgi:hypothetical protein